MKRLLMALAIVSTAATLHAADKWYDFYNKGVTAAQASDWPTTADQMQKSIALKPVEEASARAKNELILYVPHFWLGIARANLNDPDAALSELQLSQSQGIVQNTRYYSELRKWVSQEQQAKQKKLGDLSAESRKSAEAALDRTFNARVEAMSAGADRSDSFRAAVKQLEAAMEIYSKAGTDSGAYRQSAQSFAQIAELFSAAAREARARKAARPAVAVAQQQPAPNQPVAQQPPAQPAVTASAVPLPQPKSDVPQTMPASVPNQQLQAAIMGASNKARSLRDQINEARGEFRSDREFQSYASSALKQISLIEAAAGKVSEPAGIQKVMQDLSNQARTFGEKTASLKALANMPEQKVVMANVSANMAKNRETVRAQLRNAYSAFAQGNVDSCETITSHLINTRMANEDAFLLRGVARFTKATMSNQRELLGSAAADFSAALSLNKAVGLDPRLFSPKLVSFFNDVRKKNLVR